MSALLEIKQTLTQAKEELSADYPIRYLALFGSVSRGDATDESDIDILVDFTAPVGIAFIDLAEELERRLKRKVDLVSRNGIKPKYYKQIEGDLIYV